MKIEYVELKNFLDIVANMRRVQRSYFAKPSRDLLIEAKRLEAAVDVSLGTLLEKLASESKDAEEWPG